jgi:hypothetical protein
MGLSGVVICPSPRARSAGCVNRRCIKRRDATQVFVRQAFYGLKTLPWVEPTATGEASRCDANSIGGSFNG